MPDTRVYNLQCLNHGYCGQVREGHPLFDKCVEREKKGFLDALCVNNDPDNCSECAEEQRRRDRMDLDYFESKRDPNSIWFDDRPLSEKQQQDLDSLLQRMGIKKVCWDCENYGCQLACLDCQHKH